MATGVVIGRGRCEPSHSGSGPRVFNHCAPPLLLNLESPISLPYNCLLSMAASPVTRSQLRNIIRDIFAFYSSFWNILLNILLYVPHKALMVHFSQTQE